MNNIKRQIEDHWMDGDYRGDGYLRAVAVQVVRDIRRAESPVAALVRRARELNHGFLAHRRVRDYPRANTYRACRDKLIQDARALRREANA